MKIAVSKGENTISALAKRLLAEPSKGSSKTSQKEMEAALLRLNPHLKQINKLKKGTPILVPAEYRLAPNESVDPFRVIADPLLQRSDDSLTQLRGMLKELLTQSTKQSGRVKKIVNPDFLKGVFAAAAPTQPLPKEQATAITAQLKALDKIASDLAAFRRK